MKPDLKRNLRILLFVSVALFVLMNATEDYFENAVIKPVEVWLVTPFVLLLGAIALVPFINRHWWEQHYPKVSYVLGALIVLYYVFSLENIPRLLLTFHEYVSFISLIGSLFVVAGGIHLDIRGKSAPYENVILLAAGGVIANLLGTTGASMLLIRPFLRINRFRIRPYHVVFFIFIVSNVGGALTPIGDPPLFLGYLKGVPFFWVVARVWHIWALAMAALLAAFFIIDSRSFRKEREKVRQAAQEPDKPEFTGLHNLFFLAVILASVFISHPIMLREIIMWGAAFASYYTTKDKVHLKNEFNFIPIKEVGILFAGIFATMIPALDWLELNSGKLGIVSPAQYYWGTGVLSSFLDNAPTYLNFLSASFGLHGASVDNGLHMNAMLGIASLESSALLNPLRTGALAITGESWRYIQAISVASVFFGACTYIGNGPNFMVKSIAEQAKIDCPSFFGYVVKYTLPILVPLYAVVWVLYFS
ncbi:MAG: sodium:proton antiporter [Ignavibacteriales bacterium]|nr:sodium:proton antiporter [Ignavibacteriales bacterium]